MRKALLLLVVLCFAASSFSQKHSKRSAAVPPFSLKTAKDSVSYAIGVLGMQSVNEQLIKKFGLDVDVDVFTKGAGDYMKDTCILSPEQADEFMGKYITAMEARKAEADRLAGIEYLKQNGKRPGVVTTPSGLQYEVLSMGTGNKPVATDKVKVHYTGTLIDGTVFDSSVDRGEPAVFFLNKVIPGWTEGLQLMPEGSKFRFVIPSELAYGSRPAGPMIKPNSTLVFEVELISILPKQ